MMALAPESALLVAWVALAAVAIAGIVAVLVWAVRTGQFANQDRARYLPLESGIPDGGIAGVPPARGEGILPSPPCESAKTFAGQTPVPQGGPDDVQP
jgi:nitrogen fixation-related uncharacterized protein